MLFTLTAYYVACYWLFRGFAAVARYIVAKAPDCSLAVSVAGLWVEVFDHLVYIMELPWELLKALLRT